jgi:helicase
MYSSSELCRLLNFKKVANEVIKLRYRLTYGAKEELMPLLKLRNIGRVRARKLFKNNITSIADVKKAELTALSQLIGKNIAIDIKKQVGQEVPEKVKENKRKGQISLNDY